MGEAYNVSGDDDMGLADIAEFIASLCGRKVVFDLNNAERGASKATYALLNCDKLKGLGWKPLFSLKEGIKRGMD